MAFAVPASKQSIGQNRFEFTLPDDPEKMYSVPLLKYLKPALVVKAETMSELAFAGMIFEEYLPDAFDKFEDAEQMQAFMEAWGEASGISTGESAASPS